LLLSGLAGLSGTGGILPRVRPPSGSITLNGLGRRVTISGTLSRVLPVPTRQERLKWIFSDAQPRSRTRQGWARYASAAPCCSCAGVPRRLHDGRWIAQGSGEGTACDRARRGQGLHDARRYRRNEGIMPRPAKGARLWLRPEERNPDGTLRKREFGSSAMDRARSARAALQRIARAPSASSASILPTSTSPTESAAVIPLKS
jgi:hypothetical protein